MDPALYSIGVVSRMVGVPVSTLRTWEDRYGLVIAVRSSGGQRRYSRNQLAQLSFVSSRSTTGFRRAMPTGCSLSTSMEALSRLTRARLRSRREY